MSTIITSEEGRKLSAVAAEHRYCAVVSKETIRRSVLIRKPKGGPVNTAANRQVSWFSHIAFKKYKLKYIYKNIDNQRVTVSGILREITYQELYP